MCSSPRVNPKLLLPFFLVLFGLGMPQAIQAFVLRRGIHVSPDWDLILLKAGFPSNGSIKLTCNKCGFRAQIWVLRIGYPKSNWLYLLFTFKMQLCGIPHLRQTHLSPIWGFLKLVTHLRNYLQMPHFESSESHGLGMLSNPKELNITRYPSALRNPTRQSLKSTINGGF